jgi:hypothetical protein
MMAGNSAGSPVSPSLLLVDEAVASAMSAGGFLQRIRNPCCSVTTKKVQSTASGPRAGYGCQSAAVAAEEAQLFVG